MYNNINIKPEEIIMYLRKSRTDDPLLSVEELLANHEAIIDEWCERNLPYPIPKENRFKEVVSGESISDRLEFQRVLRMLEKPEYKAIIVKEISRLGRPDKEEVGYISKVFRFTETCVITPSRMFNIADEFERKMFEQELEQGNFYLEYSKRIMKAGRDLASKKGAFLTTAPYGYDKVRIDDGKKKISSLAINEEQANIVRMIFDWYIKENIGTQVISNRLNDLKIKPPKINIWKPEAIRDILENPIYIGMIRWNTRKGKYVVVDGEFQKTRPLNNDEDRILVQGLHEPIISEDLFNQAQEKRGRTHRACSNKTLRNPFASLLYCGCGKAMCYRLSTVRGKPKEKAHLVCNHQIYCGTGSCKLTELEDMVADVLRKNIAEFEVKCQNKDGDTIKLHEKMIKNLEKSIADMDAKEVTMWESQVDPNPENRMPPQVFQTLMTKLNKERDEAIKALEKAKSNAPTQIDYEKKLITLKDALSALLDDEMTAAEKNMFLKKCIRRIDYHRERPTKLTGKGVGRKWSEPPIDIDVKLMV